jgi:hypothetical protein
MSRILHGAQTKHLPFQTISKNLNSLAAYQLECKCGMPFGSPGQYRPDAQGRRSIYCEDLTPEQSAKLFRQMGLVLTPEYVRKTKGCGSITIIDENGRILAFIEKNHPNYKAIKDKYDLQRRVKEVSQIARLAGGGWTPNNPEGAPGAF